MTTNTVTRWFVELTFDEDPRHTTAIARLRLSGERELTGLGRSDRHPLDRPSATIGEEVAGARALEDLAHKLREFSTSDVLENARRGPGG